MAQPGQSVSDRNTAGGEDQPLDPATEAIRRRMARLLLGSFGVMALGLIAVFAAIVYKMSVGGGIAVSSGQLEAVIALPAGAQVVSTSLDGPHALVHVQLPDNPHGQIVIIETESGRVVRRFTLTESSP